MARGADYSTMIRKMLVRAGLACALFVAVPLEAQLSRGGSAQRESVVTSRVDPRSPRAAVADFLDLTRHGRYEAAARYLVTRVDPARDVELTRRLRAILDQIFAIELDGLSPLAAGNPNDGLPEDQEQIGEIRTRTGALQSIRLRRQNGDPAWQFTILPERIDDLYEALGDHWLRDRMPVALQRPGPFGVERWQWLMLGALIPLALIIGWFAGRLTVAIARRAAKRTKTSFDDRLIEKTRAPLLALWTVVTYRGLVEFVRLSLAAEWLVGRVVAVTSAILVTWMLVRATFVFEEELPASTLAAGSPQVRSFAPLIGRVTRIFVVAFGVVAIVAQFGYSVTALLTGLGIGGIAIAFAAQKTLEHPFGSIALGLDQPIRVGDWVKIGDVAGEVETIGLRSTRIRTLARTQVIFPNGRLAEMQMENFGKRDRILLQTRIGLTYGTSGDTLRGIRTELERVLVEHPLVWPERVVVRFTTFGESSLDIEIIAWLITTDYNVFRDAREEIFFRFMDIVERHGAEFAFPTQTIVLEDARSARSSRPEPAGRRPEPVPPAPARQPEGSAVDATNAGVDEA
jgi:MscS family membrane protein